MALRNVEAYRLLLDQEPTQVIKLLIATEAGNCQYQHLAGKLSIQTTGPQQLELMQGTASQSYL